MKDTGEWKKGNGDQETGADGRNTLKDPKKIKKAQYRGQAATTENVRPHRSVSPDSSSTNNKMPAHLKFSSPKREEERHYEPRSTDSAFDESLEILDEPPDPDEVRPAPCQESPSLSEDTLCWAPSPSEDNHRASTGDDHGWFPIPACISDKEVDTLHNATPHPPVTKESLEELELTYIQSNVTLRIDINYDHDLHFTPMSGDKGEQKKREAKRYWLSLEVELRIVYQHSLLPSCAECDARRSLDPGSQGLDGRLLPLRRFKRRLPVLFKKLKELLVILVPEKDQYQISQYLDVPLLLQEVSHGLLDIVRLAKWLDGLLTSHCAPMRDISAHEMAEMIRQGAENGDVRTLIAGIEMLFQILEAMKLDVANHQIRSFRYLLIEDTVPFQQEFFKSKISRGNVEAEASHDWFRVLHEKHQHCLIDHQTPRSLPLAVLVHGMLEHCLWHDLKLPATLTYDQKRLKEIRVDIQDFIHLDMCLLVFTKLLRDVSGLKGSTSQLPSCSARQVMETHSLLRNRIMDITDGNPDEVPQIWLQYAEAIAIELNRAAFSMQLGSTVSIPAAKVVETTKLLTRVFEHEHRHQQRAQKLVLAIEKEAHQHARKFQNMSTLAISHDLKNWQQQRAQRYRWRLLPEMEDIARRLAHIASIHWRVWADLVYMASTSEQQLGISETDSISGDDFLKMTDTPMEYVQHGRR
ncbi:Protein SOSEKI 1 [Cladophialophora chaetospira]|uniref:Protein SOSEKI 1 n=1 Tax=Cladophialophora chaetospira TaxID=386627 RepID=A0AA39CKI1_9EURO|nr:Protein SOSEKI 1 [Cladophialophora chaetospira]